MLCWAGRVLDAGAMDDSLCCGEKRKQEWMMGQVGGGSGVDEIKNPGL
jgi:hypothetical protein